MSRTCNAVLLPRCLGLGHRGRIKIEFECDTLFDACTARLIEIRVFNQFVGKVVEVPRQIVSSPGRGLALLRAFLHLLVAVTRVLRLGVRVAFKGGRREARRRGSRCGYRVGTALLGHDNGGIFRVVKMAEIVVKQIVLAELPEPGSYGALRRVLLLSDRVGLWAHCGKIAECEGHLLLLFLTV